MTTQGPPQSVEELRRLFAGLLDAAATRGEPAPAGTGLDPGVLTAINAVARAFPRVPTELISKARTTFARYERIVASATNATRPITLRPAGTPRQDPAGRA